MSKTTTAYILSDGVVLQESTRQNNRTGYTYAALSPSWTLNANKPFIAACGNPTDPTIMSKVVAQYRTSLHLGAYADAREAAYVVGKFHKDPISVLNYVNAYGAWDTFPTDLYTLPEGLAFDKAVALLNARTPVKKQISSNTHLRTVVSPKIDNRLANAFFYEGRNGANTWETLVELKTKFGKATVERDYQFLTNNEFELRYGL